MFLEIKTTWYIIKTYLKKRNVFNFRSKTSKLIIIKIRFFLIAKLINDMQFSNYCIYAGITFTKNICIQHQKLATG